MEAAVSPKRGRPKQPDLAEIRREQILDEATRVFAQMGFPQTDVQQIADNLGIGKGTIYRYFPAKRELFQAAVDRGMVHLRASIDAVLVDVVGPLAQLEAAIRAYLAYFDQNPQVVELFVQERAEFRDRAQPTYFVHREKNIGRWHDLIALMMKQGILRTLPVPELTDFISDHLYGMVFTNYFSGRKKPLSEQADHAIRFLFQGILAREATAPAPKDRPR